MREVEVESQNRNKKGKCRGVKCRILRNTVQIDG